MKTYGTTMWFYRPQYGFTAASSKARSIAEQPRNHSLTNVFLDAHCR